MPAKKNCFQFFCFFFSNQNNNNNLSKVDKLLRIILHCRFLKLMGRPDPSLITLLVLDPFKIRTRQNKY